MGRERVRLVVPVWGERYVEQFTRLTLPATLAPGNLPYLVDRFACEVAVVTHREFAEALERAENFRRLRECCPARLIFADDLVSFPAYYGLTITWSFFRGLADLGESMTDTWLLFLNADFILADGSYRALAARMAAGHRVILAPSYCTIEERVLPSLRDRLDGRTGALAIPPRQLADLVLSNLHNTVRAKTINRRAFRIDRVDQFYYVVDHDTILARQLPISLVALRPERALTTPVAIWDYGTISEACPDAELSVIGDSDEFLMMELRGRNVAADQIELGWLNPSEIARDLSVWTTRDQRRCGQHTLVLHRADLPPSLEAGKQILAEFYDRVMAQARPQPLDHRNHPIWLRLLTLHGEWLAARRGSQPGRPDATAAASGRRPAGERLALVVRSLYRAIFGQVPNVGRCHPYSVDLEPTLSLLDGLTAGSPRVLAVWSTPEAAIAPRLRERFTGADERRPEEILAGPVDAAATPRGYDLCFLELTRDEVLRFGEMHRRLRRVVRPGGRIVVLYRTHGIEVVARRDFSFITGALPSCDVGVVRFNGGRLSGWLQRQWDENLARLRRRRVLGGIRFVLMALLAAPLTYVAYRRAASRAWLGEVPAGCTSVCMDITVL